MRLVVAPHTLELGGSQLNAVELAAAVRDRGHEVFVWGRPGKLVDTVHELGLPFTEAPPGRRVTFTGARALREFCRRERIDVVHGYEWPPALDAFSGPHLFDGVAVVCTIMSMVVVPFLPRTMPLVVGTEQIGATVRRDRGGRGGVVHVLEPPVDTEHNSPAVDGSAFRARLGMAPDDPLVVIVSRLASELKQEGIERTIAAVPMIASPRPVRLAVVGDGPARALIEARASAANRTAGREIVTLTGEILDPRPAYAAADLVLGMGGSALRAMAFEKPLVVLGEDGFAEPLAPDTASEFLWHGFYGLGDGDLDPAPLADLIGSLLRDPVRRDELSRYARRLVVERFDLHGEAERLETIYRDASAAPRRVVSDVTEACRSASGMVWSRVAHKVARLRGSAAADDMNEKEAIRRGFEAHPAPPGP